MEEPLESISNPLVDFFQIGVFIDVARKTPESDPLRNN